MKPFITSFVLLLAIQSMEALKCYDCTNTHIGKDRACYSPGTLTKTTTTDTYGKKPCTYCSWSVFENTDTGVKDVTRGCYSTDRTDLDGTCTNTNHADQKLTQRLCYCKSDTCNGLVVEAPPLKSFSGPRSIGGMTLFYGLIAVYVLMSLVKQLQMS